MKANKALKRLAKIEALITDVSERYSSGASQTKEALQDAVAAIARVKAAVSSEASAAAAKRGPAKRKKAVTKRAAAKKPLAKKVEAKKASPAPVKRIPVPARKTAAPVQKLPAPVQKPPASAAMASEPMPLAPPQAV